MAARAIDVVTVVWGKEYVRLFVTVGLPSLMAKGNLPALSKSNNTRYIIYTTQEDAKTIRQSEVFIRLKGVLSVEFHFLEEVGSSDKYEQMIAAHNTSIINARNRGAVLILPMPDQVWSSNILTTVVRFLEDRKKVVAGASVRLTSETAVPCLLANAGRACPEVIEISPASLVSMAFDNLHPVSRSLFLNNDNFNEWSSHLCWWVGRDVVLLKGFHLHPVMVDPCGSDVVPAGTIDDDFIDGLDLNLDDIALITDSDEGVVFELTTEKVQVGEKRSWASSVLHLAWWVKEFANHQHRYYFEHDIFLQGENAVVDPVVVRNAHDYCRRVTNLVNVLMSPELLVNLKESDPSLAFLSERLPEFSRRGNEVLVRLHAIENKLRAAKKVAIYGAGSTGEYIFNMLPHDDRVVAFIDTYKTGEKLGIPVVSPDDIEDVSSIDLVLVTCGMPEYLSEMYKIYEAFSRAPAMFCTKSTAWIGFFEIDMLPGHLIDCWIPLLMGIDINSVNPLLKGELIRLIIESFGMSCYEALSDSSEFLNVMRGFMDLNAFDGSGNI